MNLGWFVYATKLQQAVVTAVPVARTSDKLFSSSTALLDTKQKTPYVVTALSPEIVTVTEASYGAKEAEYPGDDT